MSLENILDDIQEGVQNVDTGVVINKDTETPNNNLMFNIQTATALEGINNKLDLVSITKVVNGVDKLDRSICLEALAAMGLQTLSGRTTTNPSVINRELIQDNLPVVSLSQEEEETIQCIVNEIEQHNEKLLNYTNRLEVRVPGNFFDRKYEVVFNGEMYSLTDRSFGELSVIDDKQIMYQPYEGILTDNIRRVISADIGNLSEIDVCIDVRNSNLRELTELVRSTASICSGAAATVYFKARRVMEGKENQQTTPEVIIQMSKDLLESYEYNKKVINFSLVDESLPLLVESLNSYIAGL